VKTGAKAYSGLVPMSPKTTPKAPIEAATRGAAALTCLGPLVSARS
jgi:hypothetical protein